MYLDLTRETLYARNMKKTISLLSREPRQADFLWFSVRETAAILLDVERLFYFWAELHNMVALWLPCPGDMQYGSVMCSTAFPRKGARMWGLGEGLSLASPTTGRASSRTPVYTSAVQQKIWVYM